MSSGKVVEIIGAVVDVEFPRDAMPKVYDALKIESEGLTLEVQQQLGDGVVRSIAMGSTDGLRRGSVVTGTGAPIQVPVGQATLGRVMDVLGQPVDDAGPVEAEALMPIHRSAPSFDEQSSATEILETGIKVIDLIMPIAKGVTSRLSTRVSRYLQVLVSVLVRVTTSTTRWQKAVYSIRFHWFTAR